ncbi:hypothetical protein NL676_013248 [Syzygium grande]|nr:hypothetical protein NL676_013248 [Syzygium grande]
MNDAVVDTRVITYRDIREGGQAYCKGIGRLPLASDHYECGVARSSTDAAAGREFISWRSLEGCYKSMSKRP